MFKIHRTLLAAALLVAATSSSQAAPITGYLSFQFTTAITVSPAFNAANLTITGATDGVVGVKQGGFTGATGGVSAGTSPILAPSAGPYSITFAGLGTFTSSAISIAPGATTTAVQVILTGMLTPISGDANTSTLVLTFSNQFGTVGGLGQLYAPAVPEPSSVVLAGIGIAAAGLFGLRKRFAK